MKQQTPDQHGIIHLGLIITVVVIAVIGFAGYRVLKSGNSTSDKPASQSVDSLQSDNARIGSQINAASTNQTDATAQPDNVNVAPPR